jgi:hypothetical protein
MGYYYETGFYGTVEQFSAAHANSAAKKSSPSRYDYRSESVQYIGGAEQEQLRQGAIDAFFDGRPEKLAAIMQNPAAFAIKKGYVSAADKRPEDARANVISAIIEKSSDLATDFRHLAIAVPREDEKTRREVLLGGMLALARMDDRMEDVKALARIDLKFFPRDGKIKAVQQILADTLDEVVPVSGQDSGVYGLVSQAAAYESKEEKPLSDILAHALYLAATKPRKTDSVWNTVKTAALTGVPSAEIQDSLNRALLHVILKKDAENAVKALLGAHADPNAPGADGYKGRILAMAIKREASPAIIALLHEKGADFADAIALMKTRLEENWTGAEKNALRAHAKSITGKGIPGETVQEVKAEELEALRAELEETKKQLTEKTDELKTTKDDLDAANRKLTTANSEISNLNSKVRRLRRSSSYY